MEINEQFTVTNAIEPVWVLFQDVSELARCLPGAELTADNGDGTYDGTVTVKLGPISASFEGSATVAFDETSRTVSVDGRGVDRQGGSQGRIKVAVQLTEVEGHHTGVSIKANATLAGPIAQFGRTGLVNEVARRLITEFSDCLHAKLDAESPEAAARLKASEVNGLSLFLSSTWNAAVGWLRGVFSESDR